MMRRLISWFCMGLTVLVVSCNRNVTIPPVGPPPVPASPITSTPTRTEAVPPTPTPTGTATHVPVTNTFTWTITPLPPSTWTPTRTFTPLPPITWTPTRTSTPVPTSTRTPVPATSTSTWTPNLATPTATSNSTFVFTNPCVDDSWRPYPYGSTYYLETSMPNDDLSGAQPTGAFTYQGQMFRGYLSSTANGAADYAGSDRDFYSYQGVNEAVVRTVRLDCFSDGTDGRLYDLRFYNSTGTLVETMTCPPGGTLLWKTYFLMNDERYWVEVVGRNGPPGPYRLSFYRESFGTPTMTASPTRTPAPPTATFTYTPTPTATPTRTSTFVFTEPCVDSPWSPYPYGSFYYLETSTPNDDLANAQTTNAFSNEGRIFRGYLSSTANGAADYAGSDRDFYKYLGWNEYVTYRILLDCFSDGADGRLYDLRFYDSTGTLVETRTCPSGGTMLFLIHYPLSAGQHWVEVVGRDGPPGPYRLSFFRQSFAEPTTTFTPTWSCTATATRTWTPSATRTETPTPTWTPSVTRTATPTPTAT